MSRRLVAAGVTAALGCVVAFGSGRPNLEARARRAQIRTVLVSVTDKDGVPLKDLTAADFEVKEGGKPREVSDLKPATTPLRMAMLVADGGAGGFQQGMAAILQKMHDTTEVSIVSIVEQPERVVDYTTDVEKLVDGIQKVGPRSGRQATGQLMEAISDTLKTIAKPGFRPVIIVMRAYGSGASAIRADVVREAIRKTGTRLYVMAPAGAAGAGASSGSGGSGAMGQARTDYAASESASRGRDLETVLNDGSKESGGHYDQFSGPTLMKVAERIADELMAQYELSYLLPDGVDPTDRLEITSKRKNVKVQAPTRIAN